MTESFLLYTFRRLSGNDLKAIGELVRCGTFNRRESVTRLCDYILTQQAKTGRPAESMSKALSQERLFEASFPGQAYDNRNLRHTMSYLLEVVRRYLAIAEMESTPGDSNFYRCRAMRRKGLDDLLDYEWNRTALAMDNSDARDARWHFDQYDLHQEKLEALAPRERSANLDLRPLHNHLTVFYLSEMLRHACSAITHQAIGAQPYDVGLLDRALELAEQGLWLEKFPAVALYYHLYRALREPEHPAHFENWKKVLATHSAQFSPSELRGISLIAINYCIRRMNSGDKSFTREAFELYRLGLERNLLKEDGWLSGFTYKNIIRIGTLLGESEWVRQFFESYKISLHPREREALYRYNLAFLYFYHKDFARAMPLLQQLELEDRLNLLDARRMLLRSYYELGEFKALTSLLSSFSAYLRRQKDLGYHRELNLNLARFSGRLMELPPGDKKGLEKLKEEIIKQDQIAEKAWLLDKIKAFI